MGHEGSRWRIVRRQDALNGPKPKTLVGAQLKSQRAKKKSFYWRRKRREWKCKSRVSPVRQIQRKEGGLIEEI